MNVKDISESSMTLRSRKIDCTSDSIVQKIYENDKNFFFRDTKAKSKICLVCFSGNGLYYPDEESCFIETVINKNRYEWQNITKSKKIEQRVSRFIFLRDVHKQWYVEGINKAVNTVDKVFDLLKDLTIGYEVITVGNSAGGYAAVLFGCLLAAKKIFCVSGQFFFTENVFRENRLVYLHKNEEKYSRYYDLRSLVLNYSGFLFYVFPCYSNGDILQWKHISDLKNVIAIRINSEKHGDGLLPENWQYVFFEDGIRLRRIINSDRVYTPEEFYNISLPCGLAIVNGIKKGFKKFAKAFLVKIGLFSKVKSFVKKYKR